MLKQDCAGKLLKYLSGGLNIILDEETILNNNVYV
jgi:hypothetical protein